MVQFLRDVVQMRHPETGVQFLIEPAADLEVTELTSALNSLSRQYTEFAVRERMAESGAGARLLVRSVQRGSIDIWLLPELVAAGMTLLPLIEQGKLVVDFALSIKSLLDTFLFPSVGSAEVSVSDCDDAINIVKPIAEAGGRQTIIAINGGLTVNQFVISQAAARAAVTSATNRKETLLLPVTERKEGTVLVWHQLANETARTAGKRSPDQAIVSEIDTSPHAVLFSNETSFLKDEMIRNVENPYRKIYFVDVDVLRVGDKISAYRLVGYHGSEEQAA